MAPRRGDISSWLDGAPGGDASGAGPGDGTTAGRGGLDLPSAGPGSVAGVGRRVLGLVVDWGLASLISAAFFDRDVWATLGIFGVSTVLLVASLGTTIGHRLVGVQVVRLRDLSIALRQGGDRRSRAPRSPEPTVPAVDVLPPPGLVAGLARTALICLVIPAVVWDASGRGLHDVVAGTVVVRR